jgi:hypothetical protein
MDLQASCRDSVPNHASLHDSASGDRIGKRKAFAEDTQRKHFTSRAKGVVHRPQRGQ